MSMPAGWYDDGSGRQRWWDGQKWTDQFATGGSAPQTSPQIPNNGPHVAATSGRVAPVLGFAGLGLAVVGTVLACIPATFIVGVVVLIAAFVVSLIGLFKKNATKWPSIVGIVLTVVGGAIGTVVTLVIAVASLGGPIAEPSSTGIPTPSASEQSTVPPTSDTDDGRPSAETIADLLGQNARDGGITGYENMPDFWPCMGEELYNSGISDESLWQIVRGGDPLDEERDASEEALRSAVRTCDPDGQGAWG